MLTVLLTPLDERLVWLGLRHVERIADERETGGTRREWKRRLAPVHELLGEPDGKPNESNIKRRHRKGHGDKEDEGGLRSGGESAGAV